MYTTRELRLFKLVSSISSLLSYEWGLTRRIALATAELGKRPEDVTLEELANLVRRERCLFERSNPAAEVFDQLGTESEANPTPSPPGQTRSESPPVSRDDPTQMPCAGTAQDLL